MAAASPEDCYLPAHVQQSRVLVVDDDPVSSRQLSAARSGQEAWDALQLSRFRVVISDSYMPELDGVEFCRRVRARRNQRRELEQLESLLLICSYCKRIRNERDEWESLKSYIEQRFATAFTDTICPELLYEARTAAARRSALTRGPICIPWSSGEASVRQCDTEPVPPPLA